MWHRRQPGSSGPSHSVHASMRRTDPVTYKLSTSCRSISGPPADVEDLVRLCCDPLGILIQMYRCRPGYGSLNFGNSDPFNRFEKHLMRAYELLADGPKCVIELRDPLLLLLNSCLRRRLVSPVKSEKANPTLSTQILVRVYVTRIFVRLCNKLPGKSWQVVLLAQWLQPANSQHVGVTVSGIDSLCSLSINKYASHSSRSGLRSD